MSAGLFQAWSKRVFVIMGSDRLSVLILMTQHPSLSHTLFLSLPLLSCNSLSFLSLSVSVYFSLPLIQSETNVGITF